MSASRSQAAGARRLFTFIAIALVAAAAWLGADLYLGRSAERSPAPASPACAAADSCGDAARLVVPVTLVAFDGRAIAQAAVVGEPFPTPLTVRVLDASGRPRPGVTVSFGSSPAGDGAGATLSAGAAVSDAEGYASVTATANLTPNARDGGYAAWASVDGQRLDFMLRNYDPTAPSEARFVGGGTGFIATNRDTPVSIRVVSAVGIGLAGVPVRLARNATTPGPAGLGFTPDTVVTDGRGFAAFTAHGGSATGAGALDVIVAGAPMASYAYLVAPAGAAAQIRILGGGNQYAAPTSAFADPIVFEVDDVLGDPVSNVTVTATPSAGSVLPASVLTNALGRGQISVTGPTFYGDMSVLLETSGASKAAILTVGDQTTRWLRRPGGGEFWSPPNQQFAKPLTVLVVDGLGKPAAGQTVSFTVNPLSVGITLSAPSAVSDAAGLASVNAIAGASLGWNSVVASIGNGFDKAFYLPIVAPTAVGYLEVASGGGQSGFVKGPFDQPLVVRLLRFDGSPVSGANLLFATTPEFSAGAALSRTDGLTDASGQLAVTLTANNWPGNFEVHVTAAPNTYYPVPGQLDVSFTNLDRTSHGPAMAVVVQSGDAQSTLVDTAFALPLTVRVTDTNSVGVDGVVVDFAAPTGGTTPGATLSASSATTDASGVAAVNAIANGYPGGSFDVTASVSGLASPAVFHLTSTASPSTVGLTSSLNPSTYGASVTFTATVTGSGATPTGTVAFTAGATTLCAAATLTAGVATCASPTLGAGISTVTATYSGDSTHVGSSGTVSQSVNKATQTISFTPPTAGDYGDAALDLSTAAVGTASDIPVTFAVTSGPGSLSGSFLSFTGAGAIVVTASQAGNANYHAATPVPATITVGKGTATVTIAAGSLSVTYDGLPKPAAHTTSPVGLAVDVTYAGSATPPTSAGSYAVVATVNDVNYGGTASGTLTIAKAAQTLSFTPPATRTYGDAALDLSTAAAGTASGIPVTFAVTRGPGRLSGSLLSFTGAGAVVVTASQAGDVNYAAASPVQATITVGKATAVAALTPSPALPVSGQALTFRIDVTAPGAVPTGTVTLLDGGATLGQASLAAGTASVSIPAGFPVGRHALSATYGGDADVLAAAAAPLTYVIARSPSGVVLASSRSAATTNQPITYAATVSALGGTGTPTGAVTFRNGTSTLGTSILSGGVATLTVRSLARGTHHVAADYAGDVEFLASSGSLAGGQVVPKAAPVAGSGSAVAFDGESQDARIEDPAGALDGARTVELWFQAQPGTGTACLVQQGEGASLRFGLCLPADRTGFQIRRGAEVTAITRSIGSGWHHVALAAGDTDTVLYLDGAEVATLAGTFGAGSRQPLVVAAAPSGSGATDRFAGDIDELRLWSVARSAADLAASARQPVSGDASGLVGLWRFDEGSGGSLFDAAPSHLEATLAAPGDTSWIASDAWKRRATKEGRMLAPFVAGHDPDGDPVTVALVTPPLGGQATVAGATIGYQPRGRFLGIDAFTYEVAAGGLTSRFTTEVEVTRIEVCSVAADCAGGDACVSGACVQPAEAGSGGCGCTSSGQGATTALVALLLLGLLGRRRPRTSAAGRPR